MSTQLSRDYDLVIASDGANSAVRTKYADVFRPALEHGRNKYMWLGTDLVFEAFKFYICQTPYGLMQVHGYPYDATGSTFIVEMHSDVWQRAGFGESASTALPPGVSDEKSVARVQELIGDILAGRKILTNNSKWQSFLTISNDTWRNGNVVLLGDAAHTAHFSIGSGTKLAMEDALALVACLHEHGEVSGALAAYEAERRPVVLSTQRAARASLDWFESIGQYLNQPPEQFAFNIVTRSRRITYDNLRLRDPEFVAGMDGWFGRHEAERFQAWPAECPSAGRGRPTADVPPVPARRPGAEEPGRGVADGHVLGRRRPAHRFSPGTPGCSRARRRRAGDDRDGVRLAGGTDHAGLRRHLHRRSRSRPGRGWSTSCTGRAPPGSASSSATPAARVPPG